MSVLCVGSVGKRAAQIKNDLPEKCTCPLLDIQVSWFSFGAYRSRVHEHASGDFAGARICGAFESRFIWHSWDNVVFY